jgi:hypothetical protein
LQEAPPFAQVIRAVREKTLAGEHTKQKDFDLDARHLDDDPAELRRAS